MAIGKLTFSEEFNSLSAGPSGQRWKTTFEGGVRSLQGNQELQYYVESGFTGSKGSSLGINPFSINNGVLKISARPVDNADKPYLWGYDYTSGLLNSYNSLQQKYGYFEIRADTPSGKGLWPAFWMLAPGKWPPEADILEQIGSRPTQISQGVFSKTGPDPFKYTDTGVDMTKGFHTYAMDWTATNVTFFIDGKQTFKVATPSDMHEKMYVLLNLAVGGVWPGKPDASVDWSKADLLVDYVRVYSHDTAAPTPKPPPTPVPTPSGAELAVSSSHAQPWIDLKIGGANTGYVYRIKDGQGGIVDVTAVFDAQRDLSLVNHGDWSKVRNALVENLPGKAVTVKNFVDIDITTGGAANDVTVTGAKRGTISTGAGNDDVVVSGFSNSLKSNLTTVVAGLGDDTIHFKGNYGNKVQLDGGDGIDKITVDGSASGALLGGRGNDKLIDYSNGAVTLTGGSGRDVFTLSGDAHAKITDFAAGIDQVKLIGVAASQVHVLHPGGDTLIDLPGSGSVRLTGVHLSAGQMDLQFG